MSTNPRELVLIGNFPPDRQESMLRFTELIAGQFAERGWTVDTWSPRPRFARWGGTYRYGGLPKYLGYLDKFVVFPRQVKHRLRLATRSTVFHITDHSNAVYAPLFEGRALLLTCHDLLQVRSALGEFPRHRVSRSGQKYQQWILRHLAGLRRAICVSDKTRQDLCRLTGLSPAAAPVVYMGLNYPYAPLARDVAESAVLELMARAGLMKSRATQLLADGFWVGIGGAQWYKNRPGLLRIVAELRKRGTGPQRLVFVGSPWVEEEKEVLRDAGLAEDVLRLQGVSNEGLCALYSIGRALIFPSWEEGFGWPIAEAQACGCPVFTSDRAPMTEVGGAAARYIDPADPAAAAERILNHLPELPALSRSGLESAARWSTGRMIQEYEDQYLGAVQESAVLAAVGT